MPMCTHDDPRRDAAPTPNVRHRRVLFILLGGMSLFLACRHTLWPGPDAVAPSVVTQADVVDTARTIGLNGGPRVDQPDEQSGSGIHSDVVVPCVPPDWPADVIVPHIFIVGFGKTGSTYMHALLQQHPQIMPASKKEINHFPDGDDPLPPLSQYARFFPKRIRKNPNAVSIDGSVSYVHRPTARDALHRTFPCAKILFLMRDPTVRWWSYFNHGHRKCVESMDRYPWCEYALDVDTYFSWQMNNTVAAMRNIGYTREMQEGGVSFVTHQRRLLPSQYIGVLTDNSSQILIGMYYSYIKEWLEVWPRSQVLLVNTEKYFDPDTLNANMRVITDFLELRQHKFKAIPPRLPGAIAEIDHTEPGDYGALPEVYNAALRAFYAPDLRLLQEHFGISFALPT